MMSTFGAPAANRWVSAVHVGPEVGDAVAISRPASTMAVSMAIQNKTAHGSD